MKFEDCSRLSCSNDNNNRLNVCRTFNYSYPVHHTEGIILTNCKLPNKSGEIELGQENINYGNNGATHIPFPFFLKLLSSDFNNLDLRSTKFSLKS